MIGSCLIDLLMQLNNEGANIMVQAVGRNRIKASLRFRDYWNDSHFIFIEQDVRDPFPEDLTIDFIVPLASNTHPLAYSQCPVETIFINVDGAKHALDLAVRTGATVIYPSSVEIYGNARAEESFAETDTGILSLATSRSCYTESKRLCEAMCQSYMSEKGVDVRIVRLSRVFGPTMLLSDTKASSQFIIKSLNSEDIVLKSKGEQLFSYTYVVDAVSALLIILLHGSTGEAYNVASPESDIRLKDFASRCAEHACTSVVFDLPSDLERKGYSIASKAVMDGSKLQALGWKPLYCIDKAIDHTLKILQNQSSDL